jgi:hypothetical protein
MACYKDSFTCNIELGEGIIVKFVNTYLEGGGRGLLHGTLSAFSWGKPR